MFRFLPSQAGVDDVLRGPGVVEFVNGRVADALGEAQSIAPRESGDYADTLGSTPAEVRDDGVHGELWSSSSFWHLVEFGSANNPPYRVLERAVTGAGMKFTDEQR